MRTLVLAVLIAGCALSQAPRKPGLYAVFETSEGRITARLFEKDVPETVRNFVALVKGEKAWRDPALRKLVKRPLYNGITFHRVVAGEMIQAGDPTGVGTHNCGITIRDEFLPGLRFDRAGKLAMANTGNPGFGRMPVLHHGRSDADVEREVHDFRTSGGRSGRGPQDRARESERRPAG